MDDEVDMFKTVRQMQRRRPEFIRNMVRIITPSAAYTATVARWSNVGDWGSITDWVKQRSGPYIWYAVDMIEAFGIRSLDHNNVIREGRVT